MLGLTHASRCQASTMPCSPVNFVVCVMGVTRQWQLHDRGLSVRAVAAGAKPRRSSASRHVAGLRCGTKPSCCPRTHPERACARALQGDPRLYFMQNRLQLGLEARAFTFRFRVVGNLL